MSTQTAYLGRERALPGLRWLASGKVRDIYSIDEQRLLFVTSDRVSAFDVVMEEGIPYKGQVLTTIAAWWFERTRDIVENHLISARVEDVPGLGAEWQERLRGRVMVVRRARPTPVEWVVRGYIAGSGWKEYQSSRTVCGIPLPAGLRQSDRLPEPILTPTTKDEHHDLPISPAQAQDLVGASVFQTAEQASLALFRRGTEELEKIGVLLADTKFEFGLLDGKVVLIDEALTPDSSRFWPRDQWKPGTSPPSYDKQFLRDWLETLDWNKQYPPPRVDTAVLERTGEKYREICTRLTGIDPAKEHA